MAVAPLATKPRYHVTELVGWPIRQGFSSTGSHPAGATFTVHDRLNLYKPVAAFRTEDEPRQRFNSGTREVLRAITAARAHDLCARLNDEHETRTASN